MQCILGVTELSAVHPSKPLMLLLYVSYDVPIFYYANTEHVLMHERLL
jgi:hypothetical protein